MKYLVNSIGKEYSFGIPFYIKKYWQKEGCFINHLYITLLEVFVMGTPVRINSSLYEFVFILMEGVLAFCPEMSEHATNSLSRREKVPLGISVRGAR